MLMSFKELIMPKTKYKSLEPSLPDVSLSFYILHKVREAHTFYRCRLVFGSTFQNIQVHTNMEKVGDLVGIYFM